MPTPPPVELDALHIREFAPDDYEPFKETNVGYSYSGTFGPAGANSQTRQLMHEAQVAVEQEFNARTASIPQTIEVELAAIRVEGPTSPLPPAEALVREVGVRNTLIQRKSAEFQKQTAIANRFYGSDPLGKTFKDYLNQASANRRAHGAGVKSRALWNESFRAAHESRLLGQTVALLNQQQVGVLNWISKFPQSAANDVMLDRLERIARGELEATDTDKRFYTHEVREFERFKALGFGDTEMPEIGSPIWNNVHTATLEDFQLR